MRLPFNDLAAAIAVIVDLIFFQVSDSLNITKFFIPLNCILTKSTAESRVWFIMRTLRMFS